ncbi:hypothetical protein MAR_020302 [Mya arenaria]|uniref:C1q domain-containing protein n=1 Tax=Mya arenaria TaxID=6604 RepID=A0ABY7E4K1_MYAAR|nr:hypothetical protein MAR_020302 [Mya arenaria]
MESDVIVDQPTSEKKTVFASDNVLPASLQQITETSQVTVSQHVDPVEDVPVVHHVMTFWILEGQLCLRFILERRRSSAADDAGCYLHENGVSVGIRAYIGPQDGSTGADIESYGVSNSAYLRLAAGDKVRLGGCHSADHFESWSSFSGLLIKTD